MNETELMLGDWVHLTDKDVNARVTELRSDGHDALVVTDHGEVDMLIDLEPIPLTGMILERNGFEKTNETHRVLEYRLCDGVARMNVKFNHTNDYVDIHFDTINSMRFVSIKKRYMSVHDLQHAMRMCGIEKEIEL